MALNTSNTILKYGLAQIETATVVGTVTGAGNASVTITATGMVGTPKTISVPVLVGDTAAVIARKIRAVVGSDSAVNAMFIVGGTDATVTLTAITATANIANLNIAIATGTASGITASATSVKTRPCTPYVKLVDITNYPDMGSSPSKLDTTTLTNVAFKSNILGIQELPDFTFEALYQLSDYSALVALQDKSLCLQLMFGTADGKFTWQGKLAVYATGGGVDEVRKMQITLSAETPIVVT